jgi:hypothetical protein
MWYYEALKLIREYGLRIGALVGSDKFGTVPLYWLNNYPDLFLYIIDTFPDADHFERLNRVLENSRQFQDRYCIIRADEETALLNFETPFLNFVCIDLAINPDGSEKRTDKWMPFLRDKDQKHEKGWILGNGYSQKYFEKYDNLFTGKYGFWGVKKCLL